MNGVAAPLNVLENIIPIALYPKSQDSVSSSYIFPHNVKTDNLKAYFRLLLNQELQFFVE